MSDLTHFDADGKAHMVNVGDKPVTDRSPWRGISAWPPRHFHNPRGRLRQG